jgi:hypothetical protein
VSSAEARQRLWLRLSVLDQLAVHRNPTIADLDQHVSESAMPHVSKDTVGSQRKLGLGGIALAHMDLGHQWSHGRVELYKTPV